VDQSGRRGKGLWRKGFEILKYMYIAVSISDHIRSATYATFAHPRYILLVMQLVCTVMLGAALKVQKKCISCSRYFTGSRSSIIQTSIADKEQKLHEES